MNRRAMLKQKMPCSSEELLFPLSPECSAPFWALQERQAATGKGPAEGYGDEEGTGASPL